MAELYLARVAGHRGFEKFVVVKRILPQLTTEHDFVEMFLDEARIAATLQHPNVAQVLEIGTIGEDYFFTMEYLHGEDVRAILKAAHQKQVPLPLEHAVNIVLGALAGLHYAHEKRGGDGKPLEIVHRDVSPQNLFVTFSGAVKLLDFGIAKAENRLSHTRTGTLKGKVRYMSPEQADGAVEIDRRSDVYSLAVVLWELTVGRRMHGAGNDIAILRSIVDADAPRPSTLVPNYPPELERIVVKALARDRDQRYQTAEQMQEELDCFSRDMRLRTSALSLAGFMKELFGARPEPQLDAPTVVDPQPDEAAEPLESPFPPAGRKRRERTDPSVRDERLKPGDSGATPMPTHDAVPRLMLGWTQRQAALVGGGAGVVVLLLAAMLWPRPHAPVAGPVATARAPATARLPAGATAPPKAAAGSSATAAGATAAPGVSPSAAGASPAATGASRSPAGATAEGALPSSPGAPAKATASSTGTSAKAPPSSRAIAAVRPSPTSGGATPEPATEGSSSPHAGGGASAHALATRPNKPSRPLPPLDHPPAAKPATSAKPLHPVHPAVKAPPKPKVNPLDSPLAPD